MVSPSRHISHHSLTQWNTRSSYWWSHPVGLFSLGTNTPLHKAFRYLRAKRLHASLKKSREMRVHIFRPLIRQCDDPTEYRERQRSWGIDHNIVIQVSCAFGLRTKAFLYTKQIKIHILSRHLTGLFQLHINYSYKWSTHFWQSDISFKADWAPSSVRKCAVSR